MRTNKGFLELRRLEAAREIANILAGSGNRVMLDAQSLLLNGKRRASLDYSWIVLIPYEFVVAGDEAKEILKVAKR